MKYHISVGEGKCYYTLRRCYTEQVHYPPFFVERDHFVRNLSTDFDTAKEKAVEYCKQNNLNLVNPNRKEAENMQDIVRRSKEEMEQARAIEAERIKKANEEFMLDTISKWERKLSDLVERNIHPWGKYAGWCIGRETYKEIWSEDFGNRLVWQKPDPMNVQSCGAPDFGYLDWFIRNEMNFTDEDAECESSIYLVELRKKIAKIYKETVANMFPFLGKEIPTPNGEYFGKVKDRVDIKGTVIARFSFESMYGETYVTKLVTETGELVVYMGSVNISSFVGEVIEMKATIKSQELYKDEKQTKVARPKIISSYKTREK
jgi:sporulation protein YlmC with PRC-barrel domain